MIRGEKQHSLELFIGEDVFQGSFAICAGACAVLEQQLGATFPILHLNDVVERGVAEAALFIVFCAVLE